jgi:AcrR family transcriptional regulator
MSVNERVRQKQQTRAALLAAARDCFADKGWASTVVADIVRRVGVAHGTFYVHFADKDAVADALLAELNAELATRISIAVGRASGGREPRVRAAARAFLTALREERAFVGWYAERITHGLTADALFDGINPEARALLDGWLQREGVADAHRPALVMGLLALWIRIGLRAVLGRDRPRAAEDVIVGATLGSIHQLGRSR